MQEKFDPTVIILSAGKGKRMCSTIPKVLHEVSSQPIIEYVIELASSLNCDPNNLNIVISEELQNNKRFNNLCNKYILNKVLQRNRWGTGYALRVACSNLKCMKDLVLVLYGDTPFIKRSTILKMYYMMIECAADINVIGFYTSKPQGYGRIISSNNRIYDIVEDKDIHKVENNLVLCNSGIFLIKKDTLLDFLNSKNNYQYSLDNEFYLTSIIKDSIKSKKQCTYITTTENEAMGINNRDQLLSAEHYNQANIINRLIYNGVTIVKPETSYFANNITIKNDVILYPNIFIGNSTVIMSNSVIHSFSYLEKSIINANSIIGPFAMIKGKSNTYNNSSAY